MDLQSARVALEALKPALAAVEALGTVEELLDEGETLLQEQLFRFVLVETFLILET